MKILLTGADGFIGSTLRRTLLAAGDELVCTSRRARADDEPRCRWVRLDLATASAGEWQSALAGVDAAVNAAGIFRPTAEAGFDAVHAAGPMALFDACRAAGVRRVVQVSALGAERDAAPEPFLRSKRTADRHLLALTSAGALDGCVVLPSLVSGPGGESARRFLSMAALPFPPAPAGGRQPLQPVHVDDAVQAIVALLRAPATALPAVRTVPLVGPAPTTWRGYLASLRTAIGLRPAPALPIPGMAMRLAARAGDLLPGAMLSTDAWRMLERGNVADAGPITALLGRAPRGPHRFVDPRDAGALRSRAELDAALPLLRLAVAALWIWTGVVSFGLYPVADSHALLAQAGVPAALQPLALYGAAALDLLLGLLALFSARGSGRWASGLWAAQAALIGVYTVVISWRLPEQWLHPYGPISKNLPLLALLLLLWMVDRPAAPGSGRRGP